jgi:hypothetical protein
VTRRQGQIDGRMRLVGELCSRLRRQCATASPDEFAQLVTGLAALTTRFEQRFASASVPKGYRAPALMPMRGTIPGFSEPVDGTAEGNNNADAHPPAQHEVRV